MHVLREQCTTLSGAIKITRKALGAMSKQQKGVGTNRGALQLTSRLTRLVWIMYGLCADPSLAVLNVLRAAGRSSQWGSATDAELLEIAENIFLGADLLEVAALTDAENPKDPHALRFAQRRLAEARLYLWAKNLNVDVGAAPSTAALLRRASQEGDNLPAAVSNLNSKGRPGLRARRWAQKWRVRWRARLGTLRVSEKVPVCVMQQKARASISAMLLGRQPHAHFDVSACLGGSDFATAKRERLLSSCLELSRNGTMLAPAKRLHFRYRFCIRLLRFFASPRLCAAAGYDCLAMVQLFRFLYTDGKNRIAYQH